MITKETKFMKNYTSKSKNRVHFSTSLNADLIKQIKLLSVERGVTVNDLLEDAIRKYLKS